MATTEKHILNRLYIIAGLMFVFAVAIGVQLINIQFVEGDKYRKLAEDGVFKNFKIPANRGNLYDVNGNLLATSVPKYDIRFDAVTVSDEHFEENVVPLSKKLAAMFGKTSAQWSKALRTARVNKHRYFLVAKNLGYSDYMRVKGFPMFNLGAYKGGIIVEQRTVREHPLGLMAARTVGYERKDDQGYYTRVGLEGAFGPFLDGTDGHRLKQKIAKGQWKPISDNNEIEPQDGYDVISTIDVNIQDIAHHALLAQLEKYQADHGTVVVMETKTGEIKAISNLGRTEDGSYYEKLNYAVGETHEPGSTFKLMSLVVALEDKVIDTGTVVDTEQGVFKVKGYKVRDSHRGGYGKISAARAFELSSNVGVVKLIYDNYKDQPQKFVDGLNRMNLNEKLDLSIKGEGAPYIPSPGDKKWSGLSLAWMAYGYGSVQISPLQTLTFYNAIANNGEMVKPRFIREIKEWDKTILKNDRKVINPSICSIETVNKVKAMMENVVVRGTAKSLYSPNFSMAGKTGTAQTEYWMKDWNSNPRYISSFVGYFPADNPKYTSIVIIHKPNNRVGYYGADVSGPVFKRIAQKIYTDTPLEDTIESLEVDKKVITKDFEKYFSEAQNKKDVMPNVTGMPVMDAIPLLENLGLNVIIEGNGVVKRQSVAPGKKDQSKSKRSIKFKLKNLKDILYKVSMEAVVGKTAITINSIQFDSRKVELNDVFVAIRGTLSDGHEFIKKAVAQGALAVVCEELPEDVVNGVTYVQVENSHSALAIMAANYYDNPSENLKLVGVTGTNGKTTVATLLYNLFTKAGYKVGLLSTVKVMIADTEFSATHTTPDSLTINSYLRKMNAEGLEYCFMEVSSHGIAQHRTTALQFAGGIFTNLSHDHLDYHSSFAEYRDVKKSFFDHLPASAFALANVDDKNGQIMLQNTKAKKYTYALKSYADYSAQILENQFSGLLLKLNGNEVWSRLIGNFNAYNILAIYAAAELLGLETQESLRIISELNSVSGRFQYIVSKEKITAIVDYAHTPDALQNVLETINSIRTKNEELITVVGCGGDRDRTKRPIMGRIAGALSTKVVLTSDNPRTEDPEKILEEVEAGVEPQNFKKIIAVVNRKQAIKTACQLAKPNDIILIAGKGHETYQEVNGVRSDFDDLKIVTEFLSQLNK